jgi:8-hydroxy-5-deazaflavin:NADPH oxidoreductase
VKIGFIGGGQIAKTIGPALTKRGHEVMISSRTPQNEALVAWQRDTAPSIHLGTFSEAAQFGDSIIVAIKWSGLADVLRALPSAAVADKIVIDCTNPTRLNEATKTGELLVSDDSAGELVQRLLPGARVVKAMTDGRIFPALQEGTPVMPIAGNDIRAKEAVTSLLNQLGWEYVVDLGSIRESRPIESLSVLMMDYVFQSGNFNAAFTILRK